MKSAVLSLLVHLLMGLMLLRPVWFDIFQLLTLYPTDIMVAQSMRVDILDLPELERYMAKQDPDVLPEALSRKTTREKKDKKAVEKQTKLTRQEIVQRLRKRAGNILQKGSDVLAPSVSVQESVYEGAPFLSELTGQLQQRWRVPPHLKQEDLSVTYNVKILPSGQILAASVIRSSDNPMYDGYVREFVEHQLVLNIEIPIQFQKLLQEQGVPVTFSTNTSKCK